MLLINMHKQYFNQLDIISVYKRNITPHNILWGVMVYYTKDEWVFFGILDPDDVSLMFEEVTFFSAVTLRLGITKKCDFFAVTFFPKWVGACGHHFIQSRTDQLWHLIPFDLNLS